MNQKNLLRNGMMAAVALLLTTACNNSTAETEVTEVQAETGNPAGLRFAYVEIDSLMSQYQFCKDHSLFLNRKGENARATLEKKERALQSQAAELQKKYESNGFTTRDELERAQMSLANKQQELQELSERLTNELAMEQMQYNEEMRDSIQAFLKEYNKTKKFDFIISKAGDNILLGNRKYDITDDVVKGLNKRYKIKPEVAEKIGAE